MRIVQAVLGAFHHFDLAHELNDRGHLRKIYSTWPWARLKREGLPRELVESFIPFHTSNYLLSQLKFYPNAVYQAVERVNLVAFDAWLGRRMPECDAFVALAGVGLKTGQLVQRRGGKFVCDRGNTHHRHQTNVLVEEYARWAVKDPPVLPKQTALEEEIYGLADAITVPSKSAVESFVAMGVAREKLHRIPYGVRLEKFARTAPPPAIAERFEAVFVGHVSLRKGIPYLLEAFARVRHVSKRLRVIGAMQEDLKGILGRFPQASVEFLGSVAQAELPAILGSSHVLVLPSVEDGFGLVVPQAMACACPILVSSAAGSCDMVEDGVDGFVVEPRDVEAMAERMQRLIDEDGLQERMSAAALEHVRTLGGWREYGDRWEEVLYQVTGCKQAATGAQPL